MSNIAAELTYLAGESCKLEMTFEKRVAYLSVLLSDKPFITVSAEPETAFFRLREFGDASDNIFMTTDRNRIVDYVVRRLCNRSDPLVHNRSDLHIERLVGLSLNDVERRLVAHTLMRFSGRRDMAAETLGLSLGELESKLRSYLAIVRSNPNGDVHPSMLSEVD
ncbi:hypothetical protein J5J10_02465 [Ciceribacter sp. L1K23]|uniref:helix-turn-helix domain-containing protein n=1 Tax=unclassified Ciceribacter TaxID=2628820 RepID=UPI001ABE6334|nr:MULTISPECIES: helix-turn-helix domain-containing protein [unclassified Ciceribacter]MBO3761511.1 hypothetical protein [Ciceribacter sp. L1K22]MBR0554529.1 hypothetical protein [Ciceribacter sp. L1K23]